MTCEDTPKEAKLHGRQCPLRASSRESSFQGFHPRRLPNAAAATILRRPPAREIYRSTSRRHYPPFNRTQTLYHIIPENIKSDFWGAHILPYMYMRYARPRKHTKESTAAVKCQRSKDAADFVQPAKQAFSCRPLDRVRVRRACRVPTGLRR